MPRWLTLPLTEATTGVPRDAIMSTPRWLRPPERGVAPRVDEGHGALHGAQEPVAGDDGARRSGGPGAVRSIDHRGAGLGFGGAAGGRLAAGLLGAGRGLGGEALALEGLEALELLVEVGAAVGELVEGGFLLAERGLEGLAGDGGVLGLGAVLVDGVGVGLGDEAHQGLGLDLAVEVVAQHQLVARGRPRSRRRPR